MKSSVNTDIYCARPHIYIYIYRERERDFHIQEWQQTQAPPPFDLFEELQTARVGLLRCAELLTDSLEAVNTTTTQVEARACIHAECACVCVCVRACMHRFRQS